LARPHKTKLVSEEEDDIDIDIEILNKDDVYKKEIERVTKLMASDKARFFSEEGLKMYSPKFLEIVKRIKDKNNRGPHLVYSDFLNLEGISFLQCSLDANGFRKLELEKSGGSWKLLNYDSEGNMNKPAYVTYTGNEDSELREITRNIYNGIWDKVPEGIRTRLNQVSPENSNKYGDIIKVIMITKAGSEGINLRNTRYVHIMEPYWHKTRTDQVIGRARRIGSHESLPKELRTVQVFLYLSVFAPSHITGNQYKELMLNDVSKVDNKTPITTDEYLYELSLKKQILIDQFLLLMKQSAIDCNVYQSDHAKIEKGPFVCFGSQLNPKKNSGKDFERTDFITHPRINVDIDNEPLVQQKRQPNPIRQTNPEPDSDVE
jgi:hypothetical protein